MEDGGGEFVSLLEERTSEESSSVVVFCVLC